MRTSRRLALLFAVAQALACGPSVQQAALSPALAEAKVGGAEEAREARLVVAPPESRVVVAARDIARGSHPLRFERFSGSVRVTPSGGGQLRLDIDMGSLRGDNGFAERLASSMLEVTRFPHATLVAQLRKGDAPDVRVVQGNVVVHGIEHGITFKAKLRPDGDSWRLHAVFDMSRSAFDIKADGTWDPLIRDDFRVTFDLRGVPAPDDEPAAGAPIADDDSFGAGGR
jgi:polyisoprenoid-binding protein YceI